MRMQIAARVRQLLQAVDQRAPGDEELLGLSEQGELLVASGASQYGEIVRPGRAFATRTTAAVGAVVAIPTTAVMFALYNNEPDDGRVMVIDAIWAQNVVSTAVAAQAQMLVMVGQVRETAPTDAALGIIALNGLGGRDTRARTILTATALPATTGVAANWHGFGASTQKPNAVGTPGYGLWAEVNGRIIVPPGRYFALHVMANVVGETFVTGVMWHEKNFKLG